MRFARFTLFPLFALALALGGCASAGAPGLHTLARARLDSRSDVGTLDGSGASRLPSTLRAARDGGPPADGVL